MQEIPEIHQQGLLELFRLTVIKRPCCRSQSDVQMWDERFNVSCTLVSLCTKSQTKQGKMDTLLAAPHLPNFELEPLNMDALIVETNLQGTNQIPLPDLFHGSKNDFRVEMNWISRNLA